MIPRPFAYDLERKRQIDTLKIFNDNVTQIKENEEYAIQFESGQRLFTLSVVLSQQFPNEKPLLTILPPVKHSYCNAAGVVLNAPGVLNYSPHSDLGRVVQAIIREFEKFPPPLCDGNNGNSNTDSLSVSKELSPQENMIYPAVNKNIFCGQIPSELTKLSLNELKKLDSDPQFFDDFIEELNVVRNLNYDLDTLINQVELIAKENTSKEEHLNELKTKLFQDVNTLKDLGEKCEKLNQKYLKKSEEYAPQHIKELLQIAASNSDSECERHVELFLSGKIDVQTFLNSYCDSKKISAMRKAKEERLSHQLNALERAGH
ncbi:vacuolar protein sorting-associated protein 37A [Condylostylus longicornis]|uniref:vacuolar protein sorting-associated protein 37A n=1 Tax=Condylostylus longicornis TaxID=2530218 RepID=UPI00244E3DAA|nr:vacuolar protein sorting-associated protein 37A [Condylostylus longicornis]